MLCDQHDSVSLVSTIEIEATPEKPTDTHT